VELSNKSMSPQGVYKLVQRVGRKAELPVDIGCHTLRHAFGTHVARYAGLRAAQALMGHQSVETTAGTYTDRPSLDELSVSAASYPSARALLCPGIGRMLANRRYVHRYVQRPDIRDACLAPGGPSP
jgi:site-specific recombinase XerC